MAKITRALQKIFGGNLTASDNIAVYGSLKAGSVSYSLDVPTIQSLDGYLQGLSGSISGGHVVNLQDMNALFYLITSQLAYLMQAGVPEWETNTVYYIGSYCQYSGILYRSKTDGNTSKNPTTSSNDWENVSIPAANTLTYSMLTASLGKQVSKAWVCFNGTNGSIYDSFNVSSVTRTAAGQYRINFTSALANAFYVPTGSCGTPNGVSPISGDNNIVQGLPNKTTTYCSVGAWEPVGGNYEDSQMVSVTIFGS